MLDAKRSIVSEINDQTKKSESLFKIFHPRSAKIPSGRANVPVEQHRPLFTRPVKNPPIGCNKLVYEQFEPERQPWYVSTISSLFLQPLCPNPALQSGSICSPVVTLDRRETLWKTRGALHKVRTINLDFEALICLAVPRGNAVGSATEIDGSRFTGDNFERRMQSRADDTVGIHPLPMSLPVPRGFILNRLAIIDWFPNEAPLSLCVSVRDRWRGVFQRMMIRKFGDEVCRDLVKYSYVLFEKYIYVYLFLLFYHSIFECISLYFSVNILNYCNSICDKRYLDRCINCINCINCGEYI